MARRGGHQPELAAHLLGSAPDHSATGVAILALTAARFDPTVRAAVTAVAYVAADDDVQAVEQLEQAFDSGKGNAFLGPSVLGALALLGLRNAAARAGAVRYLTLLKADHHARCSWRVSKQSAFSVIGRTTLYCEEICSYWREAQMWR